VYPRGTPEQFANCYAPTWGRHASRTRPVAGNHDYATPGATGYFAYFGDAAGDPLKGYYSYDLGAWHVVVINSNCLRARGCEKGSPQERWLRADLAASDKRCTLAYWHHPLFASMGEHKGTPRMRPLFQALYDNDAEIVISGHNHNYERFAPQNPAGGRHPDPARGIRQFVVGTGGAGLHPITATAPNSEVRNDETYGVLKLVLHPGRYSWRFLPVAGKTFTDVGQGTCY
jgi:acid phosphatase type 7